jgi:hypothetical protein
MAKATDQSTSTNLPSQLTPDELSALARRLRDHADGIRNPAAKATMGQDLRLAARAIERLMQAGVDLLVDIAGDDGTSRRNVPLRDVVAAASEEDYEAVRQTLLADGHCTMGGEGTPLYHLELVGNDELALMRAEIRRIIKDTTDEGARARLTNLLGGA